MNNDSKAARTIHDSKYWSLGINNRSERYVVWRRVSGTEQCSIRIQHYIVQGGDP